MLSTASIFDEIKNDDEAYRHFLSVAAKGEDQGGWENQRIAALTEDPELVPKIRRHGEDETKHGRIFVGLLKKRGLVPAAVPIHADYCMQLERKGIGLSHERLREERPLALDELFAYLAHSRVTEQRAMEEISMMAKIFGKDPEIGAAVRMIEDDEVNHLSFCHEELGRLVRAGHGATLRAMLKRYALEEIRTYRDVSRAFVREMGRILGWGALKRGVLLLGVNIVYLIERLWRWRRMTTIERPERPNAMG